jgi:hypothetical protein
MSTRNPQERKLAASITGFNGTKWGAKTTTGKKLLAAWKIAKRAAGQEDLLRMCRNNKHFSEWLSVKLKGN